MNGSLSSVVAASSDPNVAKIAKLEAKRAFIEELLELEENQREQRCRGSILYIGLKAYKTDEQLIMEKASLSAEILALMRTSSAAVVSTTVSPRCGPSVYILLHEGVPVGTAFAVTCKSRKLLLTAAHCVQTPGNYSVTMTLSKDTSMNPPYRPTAPVKPIVKMEAHHQSDVAVLVVSDEFTDTIDMCPIDELPTPMNEEKVKCYSFEISSFLEDSDETELQLTGYDYQKLRSRGRHHIKLLNTGQEHGSSGGPVVDIRGRFVAIIVSGHHCIKGPMVTAAVGKLINPTGDEMDTDFEYSAAFRELSDKFTEVAINVAKVSCVVPVLCVTDLATFLNNN